MLENLAYMLTNDSATFQYKAIKIGYNHQDVMAIFVKYTNMKGQLNCKLFIANSYVNMWSNFLSENTTTKLQYDHWPCHMHRNA